jgi:tetratricopeptide (TPR) repeat protein
VRRLVARALSADREARLADGAALLEAILEAERALDRQRRRVLAAVVAAGAVIAAGAGALGMLLFGPGVARAERISVAIADAENQTGEAELDGLSGLFATSLEQSRRLNVLGRRRLFDLMRQEGRTGDRIDVAVARDLARRAGARAVLVPVVRKSGVIYAVDLAAVDATSGKRLFALTEEGPAKAAIPAVVDRLSGRAREELKETEPEVKASRVQISQAVTASLEAYQHFYEGQACIDRPSRGPGWSQLDCAEHFRKALGADPQFALAHYELAFMAGFETVPLAEQRALLAPALANLDRVPPKERQIILAWKSHLDGDDTTALSIYRAVVASWPEDKRGVYLQADLLFHRGDFAEAVPLLERVLVLDPEFEFALDHVVEGLGLLGKRDRLRAIAAQLESGPPSAGALHALGAARGWLGDVDGAIRAAQVAVASGIEAARADLVGALLFAGRLDQAEAEVRARLKAGAGNEPRMRWLLAFVLASQGRRRELLTQLDALRAGARTPHDRVVYHHRRSHLLTGFQDLASVRADADAASAIDAEQGAVLAVHLAYLGDLPGAARLARALPKGSPASMLYEGIALARSGRPARAADLLAKAPLSDGAIPIPKDVPLFLAGEALAMAGRDAEAVEALTRFQEAYLPLKGWRTWAVPRSRLLSARSLERLGRTAEARAQLDELLRALSRADPDLPVVKEARVLQGQLASPPAQPKPATPPGQSLERGP